MTYPRRYLGEDEEIIVERGLHPIRLYSTVAKVALAFAGCVAGFLLWKNAPEWFVILFGVIFVVTLAYLFVKVMAFRSVQFVLTNRRVIYCSGIVRRVSRDIPLGAVQGVEIVQPLLKRIIGVGDLKVTSGSGRDLECFYDLRRPGELEPMIHKAMEVRHTEGLREATTPESPIDPQIEHDRMTELHRRGVITGDELERFRRSIGLRPVDGGEN